MRILELGKFYPPHFGGIETLLRSFCEGFVRMGAEVDCVVANDQTRTVHEDINGVRVHRLASLGVVFSTSLCPAYGLSVGRYAPDLCHAHFPNPLADLAVLRSRAKIPFVLTYHSDVIRQAAWMKLYQPLLNRLLARAARIVVATPKHIEYSPWLGAFRKKCEVIPFGISLAKFAPTETSCRRVQELRAETKGRPVLLTIGRLVGYKGQGYLIEAARELDAVVWLVGTGPLENELKGQVNRLGLKDRIRFWGALADEDLPALIQACDVFVLPSITPNEAFGLVQIEAMACAKPVVSCALRSGVPYVNQDGVTGLIVPPADAAALRTALQRLFSDEAWRKRLGEAGRARAEKEFEESVMVRRYWDCFQRALANGAGVSPHFFPPAIPEKVQD
ncbi:MAG: glycosyltransferase [Chloroflexi bacterium]|nr:glycosyltransferase [Chloroflexota bacterium]